MGFRIGDVPQAVADPRLSFRLDPGEPGVLRAARASDSTLRVAEQEGRNTRRLEAAAIREGRVVTRSVRTFTRGDTGSFVGTLAGQTRVESVEPRPTPVETAQNLADAREAADGPAGTPQAGAPSAAEVPGAQALGDPAANGAENNFAVRSGGNLGLLNGGFRFASPETAAVERNLVAQQAQVERELVQIAGVSIRLSDPEAAEQARSQTAQLRREAQEIEREINRIRLAQLAVSTERINRTLLNAAQTRLEPTADLVGAATGATLANNAPSEKDIFDLIA